MGLLEELDFGVDFPIENDDDELAPTPPLPFLLLLEEGLTIDEADAVALAKYEEPLLLVVSLSAAKLATVAAAAEAAAVAATLGESARRRSGVDGGAFSRL